MDREEIIARLALFARIRVVNLPGARVSAFRGGADPPVRLFHKLITSEEAHADVGGRLAPPLSQWHWILGSSIPPGSVD